METIENTNQPQIINSEPINPKPNFLSGLKNNKWVRIFVVLLVITFVVGILNYFSGFLRPLIVPDNNSTVSTATPTTSAQKKLSSIATDSAFLQIEADLKNLEATQSAIDLFEPKLSPPLLELDVNFEK